MLNIFNFKFILYESIRRIKQKGYHLRYLLINSVETYTLTSTNLFECSQNMKRKFGFVYKVQCCLLQEKVLGSRLYTCDQSNGQNLGVYCHVTSPTSNHIGENFCSLTFLYSVLFYV